MICVDASVATKWILDEEHSDRALALYVTTLEAGRSIIAPPLLLSEVTNVVRQQMRGQRAMSLVAANRLLEEFLSLPIEIHSPRGMHLRALSMADAFGLPAAYDAHYLALAEYFGCQFWTNDERLVRQVESHLPFVRRLGNYGAPIGA